MSAEGLGFLDDTEFESVTVAKVTSHEGGWGVERSDGWHLFVTSDNCSTPPAPGETMLCFGRGVGFNVRGIVIGGRVYRYETTEQAEESFRRQVEETKQAKRYDYESKRAQFDERVFALPEPLRERVNRFRTIGGDTWRTEFEPYELFCCEQAAAIASSGLDLAEFAKLPWAEQKAVLPALSDDHSGNTFGASLNLARLLRETPESVPKKHGALCPIVGCEEYGCWAAHEAKS